MPTDEELTKRIADSVATALSESGGDCIVYTIPREENNIDTSLRVESPFGELSGSGLRQTTVSFNTRFEADGIEFPELTPHLFNYNNPYGACPTCEGYGKTLGIDPNKVIPDKSKSIYEGAIACWRGETMGEWQTQFLRNAHHFDFPVHRAWRDLEPSEQQLLWAGNSYFRGINAFF